MRNDIRCGFDTVKARDIDSIGVQGVIARLKERVGNTKVYLSIDIDVLDPAFAPGKPAPISFVRSCRGLLRLYFFFPIITTLADVGARHRHSRSRGLDDT